MMNNNDQVLVPLSDEQVSDIESRLEAYDRAHLPAPRYGRVSLGIVSSHGALIAGVDAEITSFDVLYVSTLFVDERFRRQGFGRSLMAAVEERARKLGARYMRLDTFDFQGVDFYRAIGFEEVGAYTADDSGFSEHFFLKRID